MRITHFLSFFRSCVFPGEPGRVSGLRGIFPHPVQLVAQARGETRLADGTADALGVETVVRSGRGDDVFLDHDRPHVVGAAVQGGLCRGLAHGEPRGLDVADIAQYKAAHGDDAQVFQRREPCRYPLAFQFGVRRPEDPRDECDETVLSFGAAGLQVADTQQVVYTLVRGLDMAVPGLPGGMMGSLMADLETNLESINKYKAKRNLPFMTQDELLIKLFNEVAYVWPRVGYPPLVTPFSQYVKNLAMMNVMAMEKGKERWGMIADDIWDMILGKAGRLPGKLAPEIIEKAEREGRKFFDGNPQDNYPDQLEKYRKMMLEKQWDKGQDDEELFEYAMHPAQYEAYKSGKAKEDFLADVKKRREEKANATIPVEAENKTKVLTVDVNGQPYRVTVAYGAVDPAMLTAASGAVPAQTAPAPVGEGKDVLSPLEGKFFLVKNAQETPKKVGEKVNKGDVICYVEAMKTYNAIRAEYDGTITAICANSGDTVSEDDVLMKIV